MTIVVTGATGTVGSALLRELADQGRQVRAVVRSDDAAGAAAQAGAEPVRGSFEDGASLRRAFAGAERLFLLSPAGIGGMAAQQLAAVEAAREAGVRQVVKLSSIGADEPDTGARIIRAHRVVEEAIEASGMAWTHLRPHWFLQNELGQAASIATGGVFYAPDVTRISAVDARDVAAVAARVLTTGGHEGRSYVLTGAQALGYADLADVLSAELGRPVRWQEVGLDDARASMLEAGLAAELAEGFTEIMARYRDGGVTAAVSPAVEELLGRPARSAAEFVGDHAAAFDPQVAATT